MDWGMKNRLAKIIKPRTGRTVMLAVDHGYFLGPTTGLEDFKRSVDPLIPFADTLFLTRGMLRTCVDPKTDIPIMLRASLIIIYIDFWKSTTPKELSAANSISGDTFFCSALI